MTYDGKWIDTFKKKRKEKRRIVSDEKWEVLRYVPKIKVLVIDQVLFIGGIYI